MDEESEGLSFLFSKLCEKSFKNEADIGWDIYRRPRYTDKRQKALKVCLYETLFEKLRAPWISELVRTGDKAEKKDDLRFNIYDKLSIAAFKLRIARRFDDAEKLDHFVCQWRNLQGRFKILSLIYDVCPLIYFDIYGENCDRGSISLCFARMIILAAEETTQIGRDCKHFP